MVNFKVLLPVITLWLTLSQIKAGFDGNGPTPCVDAHGQCCQWAQSGECDGKNCAFMKTVCAESCGTCGCTPETAATCPTKLNLKNCGGGGGGGMGGGSDNSVGGGNNNQGNNGQGNNGQGNNGQGNNGQGNNNQGNNNQGNNNQGTPNPGQGNTPSGGQGNTPSGGQGNTPNGGGQGNTPNGGQGNTPSGGQGNTPNPGQGNTPNPGQGGTPSPGQGGTPSPDQAKQGGGGGGCSDMHDFCCFWAAQGECDKNKFFMRTVCQKSCGTCGCSVDKADGCAVKVQTDGCKWMSG